MRPTVFIVCLLHLINIPIMGCADFTYGDEALDTEDTASRPEPTDSEENSDPKNRDDTNTAENPKGDTETEKESPSETDSSTLPEVDTCLDTEPDCNDTNPNACGENCQKCTDTTNPHCVNGECVQCVTGEHCSKGKVCNENNLCIDPCSSPTEACPDTEAPHCVDDMLVSRLLDTCHATAGTVNCIYKESSTPCPFGCSNDQCLPDPCFYDENGDGINDVIGQPGSKPKRCWRRCPLPANWNGTSCMGQELEYTRPTAAEECGARGYRLPTAREYTGPNVDKGILSNCAIDGPDNLDWDCDSCGQSPLCQLMFGDDVGQYWTSTSVTYWFQTNFYAAKLSDGTLNFFNEKHEYKVRCLR